MSTNINTIQSRLEETARLKLANDIDAAFGGIFQFGHNLYDCDFSRNGETVNYWAIIKHLKDKMYQSYLTKYINNEINAFMNDVIKLKSQVEKLENSVQ